MSEAKTHVVVRIEPPSDKYGTEPFVIAATVTEWETHIRQTPHTPNELLTPEPMTRDEARRLVKLTKGR